MPKDNEPEHFFLYNLLATPGKINFLFRTGMCKHFVLESHQFPMKNTYQEKHKTALHRIPLILHHDGTQYFVLVSAFHDSQVDRKEYMVKRAILDLKECYGWEVTVC